MQNEPNGQMIDLKCPNCNAPLENVDLSQKLWHCKYCDSDQLMTDIIQHNHYIISQFITKVYQGEVINVYNGGKEFEIVAGVLKAYSGEDTHILIPSNVKEIGAGVFKGMTYIKSVVLPDGVEVIREEAFAGCNTLEEVHLPEGLQRIESRAFFGCVKLENIQLPEGLRRIGDVAFYGCCSIPALQIPQSLVYMGDCVFRACTSLKSLTIKSWHLTQIREETFMECRSLVSAELPEGIREIGKNAFRDCPALRTVQLPDGLEKIGKYAFYETGLSTLQIPDSVTEIGASAFRKCKELTSVHLPIELERIEPHTFDECIKLTAVNAKKGAAIPEHVKSIGEGSFMMCEHLTAVRISGSVEEIAADAFAMCSSLVACHILKGELKSIGECAFECRNLARLSLPLNIRAENIHPRAFLNAALEEIHWAYLESDLFYYRDADFLWNYRRVYAKKHFRCPYCGKRKNLLQIVKIIPACKSCNYTFSHAD